MIKASEFKARCLKLMDEVAESGEEIVITKHGAGVEAGAVPGKTQNSLRHRPRQNRDSGRHRRADRSRVGRRDRQELGYLR